MILAILFIATITCVKGPALEKEEIWKEKVDFILEGKYQESIMYASGNVLPNGWSWRASK